MPDAITRLNAALEGRYRIVHEVGEGGMAKVYLADDLRHERKVALKVLKPELAAVVGAERFLAEIKTTASLQHPHILPLHDSGEADSFLFYVMPYVEGETLADRLEREKQFPVDEAVRIATAVANALDYAHRHGVIHRDIKPGNIMLQDGQPVVGDFGIALAVGAAGGARLTETGLSVGTPYYMSPEQATGDQGVGPPSDIYALGAVLYEMLVGDPPYLGSTAQAVLGQIIAGEPVSATQKRRSIPAHVDAAIRKSLEKLPADRFTAAQDFAKALTDPAFRHGGLATVGAGGSGPWRKLTFAFAATTVASVLFGGWALSRSEPPRPTYRASVVLPEPRAGLGTIALSSDGTVMVYQGERPEGGTQLWVRRWDELNASPIPATVNGAAPTLSPDGREVAFVVLGQPPRTVLIASLEGGVPRTLTESALSGPQWASDGFVYFTDFTTGGISRMPALGGAKEIITESPESSGEGFHLGAHRMAEGDGVLFHVHVPGGPQIRVADLSSGEVWGLGQAGVRPHFTATGHLVYLTQDGDFMAAPFDAKSLQVSGLAVPLISGADFDLQVAAFGLSDNGTLVYPTGSGANTYQPMWVDRDGAATPIDPEWAYDPGNNNRGVAVSPDGTRLAVSILAEGAQAEDVWIKELPRGPLTRLTVDPAQDVRPRWTQDGRVTFVTEREGRTADIFVQRADGTGAAEPLLTYDQPLWEGVVSRDGSWVLARTGGTLGAVGGRDVLAIRPGVETEPTPLVVTDFDEKAIGLSPDGRWLVYESDETGRNEVYVRPFPDVDGGKWAVSVGGGVMPRWSNGGGEIFYVNGENEMVAAQVRSGPSFEVGERRVLFSIDSDFLITQVEQYTLYDLTPDDQRFVMLRRSEVARPELIVVQNWFEELKARVPN